MSKNKGKTKSSGGKHSSKPPKSPKLKHAIQLECNKQQITKPDTCYYNSISEALNKKQYYSH